MADMMLPSPGTTSTLAANSPDTDLRIHILYISSNRSRGILGSILKREYLPLCTARSSKYEFAVLRPYSATMLASDVISLLVLCKLMTYVSFRSTSTPPWHLAAAADTRSLLSIIQ